MFVLLCNNLDCDKWECMQDSRLFPQVLFEYLTKVARSHPQEAQKSETLTSNDLV